MNSAVSVITLLSGIFILLMGGLAAGGSVPSLAAWWRKTPLGGTAFACAGAIAIVAYRTKRCTRLP